MSRVDRCVSAAATLVASVASYAGEPVLPAGFELTEVAANFVLPVDMAFAPDGRIFVAEQAGLVYVIEDGVVLDDPFIDLSEEVNGQWDRGLLGLALDPAFLSNRKVYLLYTVDPVFGKPDEDPFDAAFSRLTCYTGTLASNGNIADEGSRCVLIGAKWSEGIPVCEPSHTIGTLQFGHDGSLFVGAGDGAHFGGVDSGGQDPDCFSAGRFGADEDIGAFRAQYLGSLAGKILRIDPATGLGLPTNPHWTGDGTDNRSKVWVNGLRNPFRFALRPGTAGAGTLYIGDVGWYLYEEVSVANGGENFGWPCREGFHATPDYPGENPAHSGCDSIETPSNPGPLTDPMSDFHHSDGGQSDPPGVVGRCVVGGAFYTGTCYPELYRDAYFYMGQRQDWIRAAEVDDQNNLIATHEFASNLPGPVDMERDPLSGDLFVVSVDQGRILRIAYVATPVFTDDFEADSGYTVEDLNVDAGSWERGVPAGGGDREDPEFDFDGSGRCWLTGNTDGDSDVDGGPTRLISSVYDLAGISDPFLGYARWFRNDNDDGDRLDVHVSNDDGKSWTLVESVSNTPAWVEHVFRVSDFLAPTATVRLRFSATDNPNDSITEAAIDALRILGPGCDADTCPADFDGNDAVDFVDLLEILASWGPCGGCPQDLDRSGAVDFGDILLLLGSWGPCP